MTGDSAADLLTALHKHLCFGTDSVGRPVVWLDSAAYPVATAALAEARREGAAEIVDAERKRCRDIVVYWLGDEAGGNIVREIQSSTVRTPYRRARPRALQPKEKADGQ